MAGAARDSRAEEALGILATSLSVCASMEACYKRLEARILSERRLLRPITDMPYVHSLAGLARF